MIIRRKDLKKHVYLSFENLPTKPFQNSSSSYFFLSSIQPFFLKHITYFTDVGTRSKYLKMGQIFHFLNVVRLKKIKQRVPDDNFWQKIGSFNGTLPSFKVTKNTVLILLKLSFGLITKGRKCFSLASVAFFFWNLFCYEKWHFLENQAWKRL